jgi:hypothetical protein
VEEFISCGVWPLAAGINFEHVKVDLTLVWKLKVPLPRFPLSREDEEHDTHFLARVEPEAKNIVGSYQSSKQWSLEPCARTCRGGLWASLGACFPSGFEEKESRGCCESFGQAPEGA